MKGTRREWQIRSINANRDKEKAEKELRGALSVIADLRRQLSRLNDIPTDRTAFDVHEDPRTGETIVRGRRFIEFRAEYRISALVMHTSRSHPSINVADARHEIEREIDEARRFADRMNRPKR